MTQAQRQAIGGTLDTAAKIVALITGALVVIVFVWGIVTWSSGGLRPQSIVASDALSDKVGTIQGDISDIKKRLNDLPTNYEVADQRQHFSKLDERVGTLEQAAGILKSRVDTLEHPQFRNPRCPTC